MRVYRSSNYATVPTKANHTDAGFDLYSAESLSVDPHTRKLVSTDIVVEIDTGYYGRIAPRSGLSCKGIDVAAGVVDSGYRGNLKVLIVNNSDTVFTINVKDRIAQLVIEKIYCGELVESMTVLAVSDRGENGFGSTGV